jgi:hypothetical protein
MAVVRQQNWLGQQREDVPHLRSVESGVARDFDILAGRIMADDRALIVSGFELVNNGVAQASQLVLRTAGGLLLHPRASESGTVFDVPADRADEVLSATNVRVDGAFVPGQVNFVGIDLVRSADSGTADLVQFLNADTLLEGPQTVPLARTLDYRIVISTADFSSTPGLAPVAKVTTDSSNGVALIEDARDFMFRLGTGGGTPDPTNSYPWPAGRTDSTEFGAGADKGLRMKSWADAVMTRLWEVGGGERWFSPTADRNVKIVAYGPVFLASGEHYEWDGTNVHWKGLRFVFDNSTGYQNEVADQLTDLAGLTDLADGDCIYVDVDRTQDRTILGADPLVAQKAALTTLGYPTVPGSRYVILWRSGSDVFSRDQQLAVGLNAPVPATTSILGLVLLSASVPVPTAPVVAAIDVNDLAFVREGIHMSKAASDPSAPAANRAFLFLRSNGLSSPDERMQVCVMWPDGVVAVVVESVAS